MERGGTRIGRISADQRGREQKRETTGGSHEPSRLPPAFLRSDPRRSAQSAFLRVPFLPSRLAREASWSCWINCRASESIVSFMSGPQFVSRLRRTPCCLVETIAAAIPARQGNRQGRRACFLPSPL